MASACRQPSTSATGLKVSRGYAKGQGAGAELSRETTQLLSAIPGVTDEAVARAFDPYVVEEFESDSPRWLKAVEDVEAKLDRSTPSWDHWLAEDGTRTTVQVRDRYDEKWGRVRLDEELRGGRIG